MVTLRTLQVGVGTPRGAEAAVHAVRQWTERHATDPHRILVKLDLENAFNSVDRMAILAAVREVAPSLAPWADFVYGEMSTLWLDGRQVPSQRGVQQGDPLGPLFFALAQQLAIERTVAKDAHESLEQVDFVVF